MEEEEENSKKETKKRGKTNNCFEAVQESEKSYFRLN